ncbi:MAG: hypothetical protein HQ567_14070 [Candidatus Nealsonbacteria bacterium]|nr:hypothetical protein [Candidatus Nealsonbacteria bacterium]
MRTPHVARLGFERLEHRRLLSGVTLITHGFNSSVDDWVTAMADAIGGRPDLDVDQPRYVVEVTDPGHDGGPLSVVNTSRSGPLPTGPETEWPEIVVLLDWSDVAGTLFGSDQRSTADVAAAVADALVAPNFLAELPVPVAQFPLHLIGHSRGGSLVGRLARDLGRYGVWVDQVTTLDPHPVDGQGEPYLPTQWNWGDASMVGWENVVFWDNYWRTEGDHAIDFTGEPIAETYDLQLVESVLAGANSMDHSDVHLWYHGTIDTSTDPPANDGFYAVPSGWYGGVHPLRTESGYALSRVVGGPRPAEGLSRALGGTADRASVDLTGASWPNVLELRVDTTSLDFIAGESIPVTYHYQDVDSDATLSFTFDPDRNPLNGNELAASEQMVSTTGPALVAAVGDLPTSGVSAGVYYVAAKIADADGHARFAYTGNPITLSEPAEVRGRHVFYNGSFHDGGDSGPTAEDDRAIASDKTPLLPGHPAMAANYTSYSRGINGVMVDLARLPDGVVPGEGDFSFRVGNDSDPGGWAPAPPPQSVTFRPGAGVHDSGRVTIVWSDGAIRNRWLQVTVSAAGLGLAGDDVFYLGNAVAEAGDSPDDAQVTAIDLLLARNNPRGFTEPAGVDFPYDFDRDGHVDVVDVLLARNNQTSFLDRLALIDLTDAQAAPADLPGREIAVDRLVWLCDLRQQRQDRSSRLAPRDEATACGARWLQ